MVRKYVSLAVVAGMTCFLNGCGTGDGQYAISPSTASSDYADYADMAAAEPSGTAPAESGAGPGQGGDRFDHIVENPFLAVSDKPLSTFSVDVDTASYSKTRMFLMQHNQLPPPDAVRIEEFVNYFDYSYTPPTDEHPFAVHVETAACPWRDRHRLVRVGIKGKELDKQRPASNLVFLLDVSGSMNSPKKLPLVKHGMRLLVERLGENDQVAIAVYAGAAGLVLPSTPATKKHTILTAVEKLHAGGSTNGGEGIRLAYKTARDNFIQGGVNRVILCSDGDFNVGVTSTAELVRLAEEQAKDGIFLSILGFGIGNHNDAMLEEISNKANGNYAFIDTEAEAYKVLVEQLSGTLVTIAKDVKIQVEFNPSRVAAYRLIGYENRKLADRDFKDDTKDAGEIGAGHTVTALYEAMLVGQETDLMPRAVDELKYQQRPKASVVADAGELLTVSLRYKLPDAEQGTDLAVAVNDSDDTFDKASDDFRFAAAVASFGMLLRNSQYKGDSDFDAVVEIASAARGQDGNGYRVEFLEMVKRAANLSGTDVSWAPVAPSQYASDHKATVPYQASVTGVRKSSSSNTRTLALIWLGLMLGIGVSALALGLCLPVLMAKSRSRIPTAEPKVAYPRKPAPIR